ncbi:MAG TPA: Asd/ArgC dimerization domain-containing protein [Terriglobales bacterium]
MRTETSRLFRAAIVGGATLKGKELKDVLEERNFPVADIRLLDDNESLGQLERVQDEVAIVQPVNASQFENMDFSFFASDAAFTRANWKLAQQAGSAVVDLSYALEDESSVPMSAPWIEREIGQHAPLNLDSNAVMIAHPAAVTLALLLLRAGKAGNVRHATATVFEPVSERGRRGMDELHEQTVNLLSFQPMPTKVFGVQVAFNMVGRYGPMADPDLASVERRIQNHVHQLLGGKVPDPALLVVQAPVFHAHTFAVYLELEKAVSPEEFSRVMAGEHVQLANSVEDSPNNVNVAGKDDILLSLERQPADENGFWLWAAVDNLRLAAITATDCATALAAVRPHGKVQ